jgi:hypothetical protein
VRSFHLSWLNLVWLAWILEFAVMEGWALATAPRYTLSDTVWAIENLNVKSPFDFQMWTDVHWTIALTVWLLFGWLCLHLPFGLLR